MGQAPSSGGCCSSCEPSKQPDVEQVTHRPASVFQDKSGAGTAYVGFRDVSGSFLRQRLSGWRLLFQESSDGDLQNKEPEEVLVDARGSTKTLDLTLTDRHLLRGIPFCQTLWRGGRVWVLV